MQNDLKKKKIKRPALFTFACIVVICILVTIVSSIVRGGSGGDPLAALPEETSAGQGTEASGNGDGNGSSGGNASTDDGETDSGQAAPENADDGVDISFSEADNSSVLIGNVTVEFQASDASVGEGTVNGQEMDAIYFHDGNEDDMKGIMFAFLSGLDGVTIDTVEEAQDVVNEYIAAGTGLLSQWEETENAFVRKVTGYDYDTDGAFLYYTVIPKTEDWDPYQYGIVIAAYSGDMILESSYNSMVGSMAEYIPDSTLLQLPYEDACEELEEILSARSASGSGFGAVPELYEANQQWLYNVYGVESEEEYNALSEEEKEDLYWKYRDPVGYKQAHGDSEEDGDTILIETETETAAEDGD